VSSKSRKERKHFITLNLKLAIVVVIALIMTFLVFEVLEWIEGFVVQKYYLSEEAVDRNINDAYSDLEVYISTKDVKSSDTEMLQQWVKDHEYTYLVVSDNYSISFDGGWTVSAGTPATLPEVTEDQTNVDFNINEEQRITPDTFNQDLKNRIVNFDDGAHYVYINVYKEENFHRLMNIFEIIMGGFVLFGIILIYNGRVLGRVSKLSAAVEEVTRGNLTADIGSTTTDEIGLLADNVSTMRNYIIQRLQSEKAAWDKNSELITAMSHDIRTPLTSLIGYLDIIESGKYQTKEEEKRYITACQDKALQLKDLSDKMFQYFLVFGSKAQEKNQEIYDAGILLQQIISEHSAELINYGFTIDFEYMIPEEVEIKTDISGLRRLFDNMFSNITKYAEKQAPVRISAVLNEQTQEIVIHMINEVLTESRKVESNKIGLKTCEKICKDMGGDFSYQDEGQIFTVRFTIPVYEELAHGEEEIPEGLAGIDIHNIDIESVAAEVNADENAADAKADENAAEVNADEEPATLVDGAQPEDAAEAAEGQAGNS